MVRWWGGSWEDANTICWLVGQGHPSEKYGPSIGMISNPIYGKIKNGNQTTNQLKVSINDTRGWIPAYSSHDWRITPEESPELANHAQPRCHCALQHPPHRLFLAPPRWTKLGGDWLYSVWGSLESTRAEWPKEFRASELWHHDGRLVLTSSPQQNDGTRQKPPSQFSGILHFKQAQISHKLLMSPTSLPISVESRRIQMLETSRFQPPFLHGGATGWSPRRSPDKFSHEFCQFCPKNVHELVRLICLIAPRLVGQTKRVDGWTG